MPVGFSSPARNLFLLGSSGAQVVSNFFESISKASTTDGVFIPDEIRYIESNKKYALAGSAQDSNSKGFGWFERQDYDLVTGSLTTDYSVRIESPQAGVTTTLRAMELDSNDNLIVVGFSGTAPWIAKYSNDGVLDWQSTTASANVRYLGVTSDSNNNYYACGRTSYTLSDTQAFVEKFDSNGNPGWGKSAFMLGRDVVLAKISANDRGEVVAVGFLEDDSAQKGYIVKIDTNTGEVLWDRTLERNISGYGGFTLPSSGDDITPADVKCTACYIDSNDQIYVVGSIDGKGTNDNGVGEFLIKYSPEGNIVWQRERNTRDYINAPGGAPNTVPFDVKSDGETEQTVVLSVDSFATVSSIELSKYSKSGDLVFRRRINKSGDQLGAASLDADPSFYYFIFRDQEVDGLAGEPDRYTFGKVSTSGNGLGNFQYDDGTATIVDYTVSSDTENKIGRMSDGSVTNSISDLMTYPFTANQVVFDDLATHVSNKKRQMDDADSFEYSGSPAIRIADFQQELNLLGDVYSGSGDWLDQSGKGNNGVTSFTTTVEEPFSGAGSVEFDGNGDYLNVSATDEFTFGTGDFTIETFIYHKNLGANGNVIIDFRDAPGNPDAGALWKTSGGEFGWYVNGSNRVTGATVAANQWYHIALVRNSGTTSLYVDGISVGSFSDSFNYATKSGRAHIGFLSDGTGTLYLDGFISNFRVIKGTAVYTSNFTPPTSALSNTGQTSTTTSGTDYYTGSEWTPAGINNPEEAFTTAVTGSGSNGGNFGRFTYTFATPVTGVTSARIRGSLGASSGQVGGTTNCILVDGQDVTQKFKNAGGFAGSNVWVDVTAEVGGTWNTFAVQGVSGSTNPNVSGVEVNGVQLVSQASITITTGTMLLTAQGSTTDASDSNLSITANGDAAAVVSETNGPTHNAAGYWQFATGGSGGAFAGDYIEVDYDTNLIATGFTLEFWFNGIDTLPGQVAQFVATQGFMNGGSDNDSAWRIERNNSQAGTIEFNVNNGSGFNQNELISTNFPDGTWHHCVCTFDTNGTRTIYKNGVQDIQSTSYTGTPTHPAVDHVLRIGARYDNAPYSYNGSIGEFRIYDRVLTAATVFQNYNATKSKYINEAPDTAPKIGPGIVYGSDLLLNYDFGNRATFDTAQNLMFPSNVATLELNDGGATQLSVDYTIKDPFGQYDGVLKCNHTTQSPGYFRRGRDVNLTAGKTYTFSFYFKNDTITEPWEGRNTISGPAFSVATFSPTFESNSKTLDKNIPVGNGWYKQVFTFTPGYTQSYQTTFSIANNQTPIGSFYIAGFQLEEGSVARTYIKTYGSAITAPTTVKNLSSSSYTGTVNGGPTFNLDGYFEHDGVNQSAGSIFASNAGLPTGSSPRTMEAWVYMNSLGAGNNPAFLTYGNDAAGEQSGLRFVGTGLQVSFWTGTYDFNTGFNPGLNVWFHYVATYDTNNVIEAYVDGVSVGTKDLSLSPLNTVLGANLMLFRLNEPPNGPNYYPHDGRIGEARIYNRALTAAEVSQNFNATRGKYGV